MAAETAGDLLLVGPGWLGAPAAERLAQERSGHGRVFAVSRSGQSAPAGCVALQADIAAGPSDPSLAALSALEAIVVCVAPSSARGDSYAVYPAAAKGAAALAAASAARALVYVSSTGIYDRHDGSVVDEDTPIEPTTDRVQALYDAERTILAAATPSRSAIVLRAAGLYGPGRDPAGRFARGATSAETWCNFSWRDDVIEAIVHVLTLAPTGEGVVFNCTDNTPVLAGDITFALTGAPVAEGAVNDASGPVRAGRSNQRISSAALIATGWRPAAPTVFDGLAMLGHALPGRRP